LGFCVYEDDIPAGLRKGLNGLLQQGQREANYITVAGRRSWCISQEKGNSLAFERYPTSKYEFL
jgi:hypothetical protein